MSTDLRKFVEPFALTLDDLASALGSGSSRASEPCGLGSNFPQLELELNSLNPELTKTSLDEVMIPIVHRNIELSHREAAMPGVWQWLSCVAFQDLVWRRWAGGSPKPATPAELREHILTNKSASALKDHYLCRPTLGLMGSNMFSRLWWAAEILGPENDYELARAVASNAQLFVDLFERRLGLNPSIARACVRVLRTEKDQVVKDTCRRVNQRVKTTQLETLSDDALDELVLNLMSA